MSRFWAIDCRITAVAKTRLAECHLRPFPLQTARISTVEALIAWSAVAFVRPHLRVEVASTVSDPTDVDEELHYPYEILLR